MYVYVQSKCISTTPKTTPFILGEFQYNKVRAHITHTHNTHTHTHTPSLYPEGSPAVVSVETSCDVATPRAKAGPKTCPLCDREREGGRVFMYIIVHTIGEF